METSSSSSLFSYYAVYGLEEDDLTLNGLAVNFLSISCYYSFIYTYYNWMEFSSLFNLVLFAFFNSPFYRMAAAVFTYASLFNSSEVKYF